MSRLRLDRVMGISVALAALPLVVLGCSSIVDPDGSRIGGSGGGGQDAGSQPGGNDGRVPPGSDAGDSGGGMQTSCPAPSACRDGALWECRNGERVRTACPLGCAAGGDARCRRMVPSNVARSLWVADAQDASVTSSVELDTSACNTDRGTSQVMSQNAGSGPEVCVVQVGSFRVAEGATLRVVGDRPLVIMASGDVEILGNLDASAAHETPGPGGGAGGVIDGNTEMRNGSGVAGGQTGERSGGLSSSANGGGGGGALCGAGGDGGGAQGSTGGGTPGGSFPGGSGGTASVQGGSGGQAIGSDWLVSPLRGGSGGAAGRGFEAGAGGAGGGAVQISSQTRIRVAGTVQAAGGGGLGGTSSGSLGAGAGGGGGSGGAVLLEAPTLELTSGSRLNAAGGGGGGGVSSSADGEDGQDGAMASPRARGGGGGTPGGDGGGGATLAGANGETGTQNGGGGGGGAGCILLRSASGTPGGLNATPSTEPGLRTRRVRTE